MQSISLADRMTIILAGASVLFATFACIRQVTASTDQGDTAPMHGRVLWMENPAHEAVISWTTRNEGNSHRVYYDTRSRNGNLNRYEYQTWSMQSGRYTTTSEDDAWVEPAYYHHVHLVDLEPDTVYYLVIASDRAASRELHFKTAPADDHPFAILFGGDSRIAGDEPYEHNDRRKMNRRIAALAEAHPDILALAHGGDYCQRAEWRYLKHWLDDYELTTTADGRLLPIIPARGNHDRQVGFEEMFYWPGRERNYYYAADLSPQVTLVTLNTETSLAGSQRIWLQRQLSSLRPDRRWVLAQYHRPAYSSVRSMQDGASRRDAWVPLFERYNVDMVCESHDHALKRTLPIRSGAPESENGITYIGDGGLGVPQRQPDPDRWWLQPPGFTRATHHVHLLEFSADQLRVRAFGMDGDVLDDFTLQPQPARAEAE